MRWSPFILPLHLRLGQRLALMHVCISGIVVLIGKEDQKELLLDN